MLALLTHQRTASAAQAPMFHCCAAFRPIQAPFLSTVEECLGVLQACTSTISQLVSVIERVEEGVAPCDANADGNVIESPSRKTAVDETMLETSERTIASISLCSASSWSGS